MSDEPSLSTDKTLPQTSIEQDAYSRQFRSSFWGKAAKGENETFKSPISFQDPVNTIEFSKYVQLSDPILDFGCGYGRVTNILYQSGYKNIVGIDFSEAMINRGKEDYPHLKDRLQILPPDYNELPFANDSYAAITVFTVLNAIPTQTELEKLFLEFRRILKPGGILYIYDFLITDFDKDVARYKKFQEENSMQNCPYGLFKISSGAIIRHFSRTDIEKLMEGFKILWYKEHQFVTMSNNPCLQGQWISQQTVKLQPK
jgi:SAM-dependent methyltransferase